SSANVAGAAPTTGLAAAAGDEVSAAIAALFNAHAREYQEFSARVAMFHDQFVRTLQAGTNSYTTAEAANAGQQLLDVVNAPARA
ncbi:PE family protein, partial [Mycobacterium kansasii]